MAITQLITRVYRFTCGLITSVIRPPTDSTSALTITKADGTTAIINIDSSNKRVGIGTVAPSSDLHVNNASGNAQVNIQGATDGDTGFLILDSQRTYKFGINVGGTGSGVFTVYDISGGGARMTIDTAGNTNFPAHLSGGYLSGTKIYTTVKALTPGATVSLDANQGGAFTLVPGEDETINLSNGVAGQYIYLLITSSGTTPRTITFGTNFITTGTLSTGSVNGKKFVLQFQCFDGTNYVEVSRTVAM